MKIYTNIKLKTKHIFLVLLLTIKHSISGISNILLIRFVALSNIY